MNRFIVPCLRLSVLMSILLLGSGCAIFSKRPLTPGEFRDSAVGIAMTHPDSRAAAYDAVFAPLPKLHLSGDMVARSRWAVGRKLLNVTLFALDSNAMRLVGTLAQQPLIDIVINDEAMTVVLYKEGRVFRGQLDPYAATPVGETLGVEPWDLLPVFLLGQIVAVEDYTATEDESGMLRPGGATGGLEWIELDRRTGLPREAFWKRGEREWSVRYLEWDYFEDDKAASGPRLLPRRVRVVCNEPAARIDFEVRDYRLGPDYSDKIFEIYQPYRLQNHPLSDLKQFLAGQ